MANIAKIIDQAWQAMNENKKAEQEAVQKQVQQVAEKKNAAKAPATKPVQTVKPVDNRTTAQKVADSQAAYDSYMGSEEKKQNQQAANRKAMQETFLRLFAVPGTTMGEMPLSVASPVPVDPKELELKATADYYKGQQQAEQDRAVMDADLAEYESWSAQDKANMEQYLVERNQHQSNIFGEPQFDTYNLNPIFQTKDPAKVRQIAESIQRSRNAQAMEQATAAADQLAQEHPVLGSAASVATNLASAYTGPVEIAKEMANRTGRYQTMDPNNLGGIGQQFGGTVRQNVTGQIQGDGSSPLRQVAALGYNAGMSVADSLARRLAGGLTPDAATTRAASALAATGTFTDAVRQYSAQGAEPGRAMMTAAAVAAIDYLTNKYTLEKLIKIKPGDWAGFFAQTFAFEPSEELTSLIGGMAAEAVILGKSSPRKQRIGEMVAHGMSLDEAKKQVNKELLLEVGNTYLTSAIAGGGSAAIEMAGKGISQLRQPTQQEITERAIAELGAELAKNMPAEQPVQLTEGQRAMQQAADEVVGVKPVEQTAAEVAGAAPAQPEITGSKEHISMEDYANNESPVWRNVAYEDDATKAQITSQLHDDMVASGNVVQIADEVSKNVDETLPDLRGMKKAERGPILRQAISAIKANLRQYLGGLTNQNFEFEVNGKILDAKLYNTGIKEVLEKVTNEKAKMLYTTEDIFRNARYLYSTPDYDGDPNVYRWNYFYTPVKIGEETVGVRIAVRDMANPQESQVYNWNIKKDAPFGGVGRGKNNRISNDATSSTSNDIVTESGAEVKGTGAAEQNKSVGGMASQFEHDVKRSKIYDNTYANSPNADVRLIGREAERQDPNIGQYDVITEKESLHEAELRTETGRDRYSEYRYLIGKDGWTGADNDTAARLLDVYRREKKTEMFTALAKKQREMGTQAGQMIQSFAKYSRANATDAAADAILDLDKLTIDQIDTTFWNPKNEAKSAPEKKNALQKWKESVSTSLLEVADDIDHVADGDSDAMRAIVRQLANLRHTTAMAGYSSELTKRTERGLAKMDFETLKTVAKTQLSMIPNDFRKRSTGEIVKQIRMQNMLFTLTTKFKNDTGNISNGIMDSVSDSFGGRAMDVILSKYTGKRTVANDTRYAPEYLKAARDAADVAAAFVSLDIPMETDAKYAAGRTRTWSPNTTSTLGRLMSAYEKHMKYALEVSDKFYEGGTSHIVSKSLESLGEKSGLTAEEIKSLAEKTGARRTFKDPGVTTIGKDGRPKSGRVGARVASGIQRGLNEMGTENIGAGDLLIPFAKVAAEVKQVGIDYTGSGMITGMSEMIGIIKDAKAGKEIDPYRQRKAATDFGRGMTGVALTALFTAMASVGTIKVHNDKDKEERTMDQAQGLSGAQWNLGSAIRWLEAVAKGATEEEALEAAKWKHGDELTTVDFLEPFNTQMHIGCLIAEGESIPKSVLKGNLEALLEMPMMQTFSDLADITQAFTEISEGDMGAVLDATGQLVGTVAGAAIPNFARKAAQVIDPYFRDTYDTNPLKKAGKELVAGIPGASMLLPRKYDNLGQEQRRYEEGEGFTETIDALITPWDTKTYQTNPVYQEVERLNAALAGTELNVTPPQPKRKISYTDNTGQKHKDYAMTAEEYENVAKTQGQTAAKLLDRMIDSPDFKALSDQQKAYAFDAVYQYAQEQGKKAALSDYHSEADAWIKEVADGDISAFIKRGASGPLRKAVDNTVAAISNGWKVTGADKKAIEETYSSYTKLSDEAKQQVRDGAEGDTAKYLEVRDAGVDTASYIKAVEAVKALEPEGGHKAVVPGQRWEAALEGGTTSEAKDALVKAYMDDYNPESSSPDKTELKYDYLRQELNRSPEDAIAIMRAKQEGGGKDAVMDRWSGLGYSPAECKILWNLLGTTGDKAIDVVSWHNSKTE